MPPDPVSSTGAVPLGSRIEIFPSQPLPDLNTANASAFAARFRADAASDLFALVCLSALPPRLDAITAMRSIDNPAIVRLIESGVVPWTGGSHVFVFVYQRPVAQRMLATLDATHPVPGDDALLHHFITPMIRALLAMAHAGLAHGAIRPQNIFWRIGTTASPQLGECLSCPAGYGQSAFFEPVERAMAMPQGRGPGTPSDDIYAFGATLALLLLGRNPLQGLDESAIIDLKLQRGSFTALIGSQRLGSQHIELLRGTLADDARQRWSAADLEYWLSGRRMTLKSSDAGRRATRHFEFDGKEYWQTAPLAMALAANVPAAAQLAEGTALDKWLRRALGDEDTAREIERVIHNLKQGGKTAHYEDQLVARVCIALDPGAPIRYRGLCFMPAGVATLLAEAAITGTHTAILAEIIASQLVTAWVEAQRESRVEQVTLIQAIGRMQAIIERTGYGNGFERVVYELNPGLPCLSPMLRGQFVAHPRMLAAAVERVAAAGNRPREPMDRHIAAYLIVYDRRGEAMFEPMNAPENAPRRGLGLLALYADLQTRYGPDTLPSLAAWLAPMAEPIVKRFFGKGLRDQISVQVKSAVTAGNLPLFLRLVDDPQRVTRDRQDFLAARILYLNTQKEIAGIEARLADREAVVRQSGKPMAASISSFLAMILICAAVLKALLGWLMVE